MSSESIRLETMKSDDDVHSIETNGEKKASHRSPGRKKRSITPAEREDDPKVAKRTDRGPEEDDPHRSLAMPDGREGAVATSSTATTSAADTIPLQVDGLFLPPSSSSTLQHLTQPNTVMPPSTTTNDVARLSTTPLDLPMQLRNFLQLQDLNSSSISRWLQSPPLNSLNSLLQQVSQNTLNDVLIQELLMAQSRAAPLFPRFPLEDWTTTTNPTTMYLSPELWALQQRLQQQRDLVQLLESSHRWRAEPALAISRSDTQSHPPPPPRLRSRLLSEEAVENTVPMESPDDVDHLSQYQILIRRQLEFFVSQEDDATYSVQGRKKQVHLGQVGIRCRHCSHLPHRLRGRGAGYYPAKLAGVYQAAQNMATNHLNQFCSCIPLETREALCSLRGGRHDSAAGGGKQYWADKCNEIGLVEFQDGVYFQSYLTFASANTVTTT